MRFPTETAEQPRRDPVVHHIAQQGVAMLQPSNLIENGQGAGKGAVAGFARGFGIFQHQEVGKTQWLIVIEPDSVAGTVSMQPIAQQQHVGGGNDLGQGTQQNTLQPALGKFNNAVTTSAEHIGSFRQIRDTFKEWHGRVVVPIPKRDSLIWTSVGFFVVFGVKLPLLPPGCIANIVPFIICRKHTPPEKGQENAMSRFAAVSWILLAMLITGCADNSMMLKGKLTQAEQQQQAMTRQNQQLQDRTNALDRDNQEMGTLLAQSRQQAKVSEDQLAALRDQLRGVTAQLAQVRAEKDNADKRVQTMTASMQRQGGVTISPNNSFVQNLPAIQIPGVFVRRDGDVIRIELPGNSLFESGSSRLRPGAANLVSDVAAELVRTYPDQIIGVEGHTDNDPISGNQFRNNHELSVARAMTVYDVLVNRTRLQGNQLFVVGHGSNHPIVSNATIEGKQRNRRVELVVYPEKKN